MDARTTIEIEVETETENQPLPCCGNCGSERLHGEEVQSAFWHGERLVVVEDIPALVCDNCHEQYYDDATIILLDLLRGEGFPEESARAELRVPVFSLRDKMPAQGGS